MGYVIFQEACLAPQLEIYCSQNAFPACYCEFLSAYDMNIIQ